MRNPLKDTSLEGQKEKRVVALLGKKPRLEPANSHSRGVCFTVVLHSGDELVSDSKIGVSVRLV